MRFMLLTLLSLFDVNDGWRIIVPAGTAFLCRHAVNCVGNSFVPRGSGAARCLQFAVWTFPETHETTYKICRKVGGVRMHRTPGVPFKNIST